MTSAQSAEYSNDIEIIARSQDGTESYTFSILDEDGFVIASSDKDHIDLGTKLAIVLNENK